MSPTIRRALPADLDALAANARRSYDEHYGHLWTRPALEARLDEHFGAERLARELAGVHTRYDLLFDGDVLVGYAKTRRRRALPARDGTVDPGATPRGLELEKLYFVRGAVGRGHGSAMLAHVLALARSLRAPFVWLDVLKSNDRGIRFYQRVGFTLCGEIPFRTDLHDIGMWLMRCDLADPPPR